jgi:NAD(P)H-hydrate repair Nnr-like enzyme with NAD(P)H-hydrate dehydratase domain
VSNNDCVAGAGAAAFPLLPNTGFPAGAALLSLSERGDVFAGGTAGFLAFRSSSAAFTAAACASSISRMLAAERWYEWLKLTTCRPRS